MFEFFLKKKKTGHDRSTNKDPCSASMTMLNKNQCVLFYSLVSLFWMNFDGLHTQQTLFLRLGSVTQPGQTTSMRVETILFNYFGTDCNLAHLKCQT